MYGYIYLIVNNVNGKTYVGKRKFKYKSSTFSKDGYMGSGKYLKAAQKKYGIENFEKFLITYTSSEEDACEKEQFWITEYRRRGKAEYNISKGGDGGDIRKGYKNSPETRKKLSESWKKRKENGWTFSDEALKKMANAKRGKKLSEETKRKMSEARKGPRNGNYGRCFSEEHRKKISEANKGKHWYTNGIDSVYISECPVGYRPGRVL